jgi:hypothetical protein
MRDMELRWKISDSASCFHAAGALASGRQLVDIHLAATLQPALEEFVVECQRLGCEATRLLDLLAMLGADIDNNQQLAGLALSKFFGRRPTEDELFGLSRQITALEHVYLQIRPQIAEELVLRAQPLREQWEARGAGLLLQLLQLTEPLVVAEAATAVVVQPVLGGFGAAFIPSNLVRIEGVIADPLPNLPETVRLAWLLSQLSLDLPVFQDQLQQARLFEVGRLALLPAVLTAAEKVELVHNADQLLPAAFEAWEMESTLAPLVQVWWDTYCTSKPRLAIALAALDEMLRETGNSVPPAVAD